MTFLAVFEQVPVARNQRVSKPPRRGEENAGSAGYRSASQSASAGEVRSVSFGTVTVPFSAP